MVSPRTGKINLKMNSAVPWSLAHSRLFVSFAVSALSALVAALRFQNTSGNSSGLRLVERGFQTTQRAPRKDRLRWPEISVSYRRSPFTLRIEPVVSQARKLTTLIIPLCSSKLRAKNSLVPAQRFEGLRDHAPDLLHSRWDGSGTGVGRLAGRVARGVKVIGHWLAT